MAEPGRSRPLALALLALGAIGLFAGGAATWAIAGTAVAGAPVALTGAECLPAGRGIALLALAAIGGLLAARGRSRQAVGVAVCALALLGLVALVGALRGGLLDAASGALPPSIDGTAPTILERSPLGPTLTLVGLLLVAAGGAVAALTSSGWPALGSRYERPAPTPVANESADGLWAALDRGEDPTL